VTSTQEIADSIRRYAYSLLETADILDPPRPRKRPGKRRQRRIPLPELDASQRERLHVISDLHPPANELADRVVRYSTEQPK
jgi:hypothetical protein